VIRVDFPPGARRERRRDDTENTGSTTMRAWCLSVRSRARARDERDIEGLNRVFADASPTGTATTGRGRSVPPQPPGVA